MWAPDRSTAGVRGSIPGAEVHEGQVPPVPPTTAAGPAGSPLCPLEPVPPSCCHHCSPREASPSSRAVVSPGRCGGGGVLWRDTPAAPSPWPHKATAVQMVASPPDPAGLAEGAGVPIPGPRQAECSPRPGPHRAPPGGKATLQVTWEVLVHGPQRSASGTDPHKPGDPEEPEPWPHTCLPGSPRRGPPGAPGPAASGARLAGCPRPQARAALC